MFEDEFLRLFSNIEDVDSLWTLISVTTIYDDYTDNLVFEGQYSDLEYDMLFSYFSSRASVNRYTTVDYFEQQFDLLIPREKFIAQPHIKSKVSMYRPIKKKKGASQKLKTLLEQRVKRLKMMSDNITAFRTNGSGLLQYECVYCGIVSRRKRKLFVSHVLPEHLISHKKNKRSKSRKKNKFFVTRNVYMKSFICSYLDCSIRFSTRYARKRHILNVHKRLISFNCSLCVKGFRDMYNLARHKRLQHKLALTKCTLCNYRSSRKCNLLRHYRVTHNDHSSSRLLGFNPCSVCGKEFSMAYTFKRHMQIHEAISIGYDCPVCGLRREENHVCVFNCSYCDNSFSS